MGQTIFCSSNEDLQSLKINPNLRPRKTSITFNCEKCGVFCIRNLHRVKNLLCKKCNTEKTSLERYGSTNVMKLKSFQDKCKVVDTRKQKEIVEKRKQTYREKTGFDNASQNPKIKNIKKQKWDNKTLEEKERINQKVKYTKLKKYGNENYINVEKAEQTCLVRYNVTNPSKLKNVKNKKEQTSLENWGVNHWMKSNIGKEIFKQARKNKSKLKFEDLIFDSSWELAYYKYLIDSGKDFEYQPDPLTFNFRNDVRYYYPDFKIGDQYVEIKGEQFFEKVTDKFVNPFDRSLEMDELMESKWKCMIDNNVQILRWKDLKEILRKYL